MKVSLSLGLALLCGQTIANGLTPERIFEINKEALDGGERGRPSGHETKPYKKNLPDPYVRFYEGANAKAVMGED